MVLKNVHEGLLLPEGCTHSLVVRGEYEYWHYGIDDVNDKGWGCGYRTLQTLISWFINTHAQEFSHVSVPSIRDIQNILVNELYDKEPAFLDSKEWIGCFEAFLVIDTLLSVPCKLLHIRSGNLREHVDNIRDHLRQIGTPIMMGGDIDCSAKGILGITESKCGKTYLLIVDPHFVSEEQCVYSNATLQKEEKVLWKCLDDFDEISFYNLCLPIHKPL